MSEKRQNFLTDIIDADLAAGRVKTVVTRFPPEPNGWLHIGHAKSICLNFGVARDYQGRCHMRFDDTNPTTEDVSYVESIQNDVKWLGFDYGKHLYYASDYFDRMYECAVRLVKEGKAYVDHQNVDQIREHRGNFDKPGVDSPFRGRAVDENLALFEKMKAGGFKDGECVLRAKIDMGHPNVLMRDPLLYRIRHAHHHRTADKWCIYPMYDYAHPLEDAFEGVTHSICTLEFETNRELYDWVLDNLGPWDVRPHQYEFARLALDYTVMSKRKLLQLVTDKHVSGWDDPRMPTIAGMRRRGVTPEALRDFADRIGVAKNNSTVDIGKLEYSIRQDLEARSPRAMAVLDPLKVTLTNWPEGKVEELEVAWWPGENKVSSTPAGSAPMDRGGEAARKVPFTRELFIDREDFAAAPPKDWKRLAPGWDVRLNGAYVIHCDEVVQDAAGAVTEVKCTVDLGTRGGKAAEGRKPAGTLHWVSATHGKKAEVRLYDRLFKVAQPDADPTGNFLNNMNEKSLVALKSAYVEPALAAAEKGRHFQFLRLGYFFTDPMESKPGAPVFNRTITLRDTWAKAEEARPDQVRAKKDDGQKKPSSAPKKSRADLRAELRAETPQLAERYARYQEKLGLSQEEADLLTGELALTNFFDDALTANPNAKSVARWTLNDLAAALKDTPIESAKFVGREFGKAVAMIDAGRVTGAGGKALITALVEKGGDPEKLVKDLGLEKNEDSGAVEKAIDEVLASQKAEVERYKAGEKKLFGVLMGAAMKATRGTADAALVKRLLTERLG